MIVIIDTQCCLDERTKGGIRMKLERHIEYIRNYIGKCIDGEQEFDIHELWEWLDSLMGEEE